MVFRSKYPDKFAAIAPVVAWGHPQLIPQIAQHNLPIWVFAGGKDLTVEKKFFYKGMAMLESLGHTKVQFTIHEDLGHDAWKRVYSGDELYQWFLFLIALRRQMNNLNSIQYIVTLTGYQVFLSELYQTNEVALDLEFDRNRYGYGFQLCLFNVRWIPPVILLILFS